MELSLDIDIFSGPFETLVSLVKERKLPIKKVSVGKIADMFKDYVKANIENLNEIGEYLRLSAYLTYLKSKELLPRSRKDPAFKKQKEELISIIENYDIIQKTVSILKDSMNNGKKKSVKITYKNLDNQEVKKQLSKYMLEYINLHRKLEIIKEQFTVEKALEILRNYDKFTINDLLEFSNRKRIKFIVFFLAALVLVRNGFYMLNEEMTEFYRVVKD